ncbi:MAG: hypothetical protein K0U52_12795 [Gammaproteobacteria bacterium]|nr:hypothetical protein [Gammaproteobacteria bacterium]
MTTQHAFQELSRNIETITGIVTGCDVNLQRIKLVLTTLDCDEWKEDHVRLTSDVAHLESHLATIKSLLSSMESTFESMQQVFDTSLCADVVHELLSQVCKNITTCTRMLDAYSVDMNHKLGEIKSVLEAKKQADLARLDRCSELAMQVLDDMKDIYEN